MMDKDTKTFFVSILAGMFLCSMIIGIGGSVYKQRKRIRKILKTQVFAVFKGKAKADNLLEQKDVYPQEPIVVKIDARVKLNEINPLIFGTNLVPYSESERDIIEYVKDTGFTVFRFPGNGASGYHWKTGKSDFRKRADNAPLSQMDYLIEFCKLANTQLLIQVNVESGTAQEAAEWVEYMNKTKGFRVDYWQLGDEVFGDWDKGYMSPKKYAEVIKEYAKAMKKVDPNIKIGMDWAPNTHDEHFNIEVMKRAGNDIDFIAYHWYPNHVNHDHIYRKRIHPLPRNVMANPLQIPTIVERMREIIAKYAPKREEKIEIAFTGWESSWDAPNFDYPPYSEGIIQWSLANGIFHAETLAQFAQNGVSVANQYLFQDINFGNIRGWDKQGGWGGSRWDGVSIRPKGLGMKLVANHFKGDALKSEAENSPYYFKRADWWPDSYAGKVAFISSYASLSKDTKQLSLMLINKHESKDFTVNIQLDKFKPQSEAELYVLTGPHLEASNERNPDTVRIQNYFLRDVDRDFKYVVPARSVNVIKFSLEE